MDSDVLGIEAGYTAGPGRIKCSEASMQMLAEMLSGITERAVTDKTGLDGTYEIDLKWAPEQEQGEGRLPDLFTALKEQLGLQLRPTKLELEVLFVDKVEQPSEN